MKTVLDSFLSTGCKWNVSGKLDTPLLAAGSLIFRSFARACLKTAFRQISGMNFQIRSRYHADQTQEFWKKRIRQEEKKEQGNRGWILQERSGIIVKK